MMSDSEFRERAIRDGWMEVDGSGEEGGGEDAEKKHMRDVDTIIRHTTTDYMNGSDDVVADALSRPRRANVSARGRRMTLYHQ